MVPPAERPGGDAKNIIFARMLKTILRYALLTLIGIIAFVIILVLFSVAPIDSTPAPQLASYDTMMKRLDNLDVDIAEAKHGFLTGFGKENMTPSEPIPTAGYGKRRGKPYNAVHDSIYVRAIVISNGAETVAIVSADLLIIPPTVTKILGKKLSSIGFSLDNTYLGATHSHNSIGQWGERATGIIYGDYDASIAEYIADAIVMSIRRAKADLLPSTLRAGAIPVPEAVENRLIDGESEDPLLRVVEVHRADSSVGVLLTYAAHATCLSQGTLELSRDYPGALVDELESRDYAFAMFMAGAVGSHRGSAPVANWECMEWMAETIADSFFRQRDSLHIVKENVLAMVRLPLALSEPQVKVSDGWKIRSWLFRTAFGEYDVFITGLRIGEVLMFGTPCDFSGQLTGSLDSLAHARGTQAMVTSFNGGYIGYITPERFYDVDHYETRLMNWYAPGTGEYLVESLQKLMIAMTGTR